MQESTGRYMRLVIRSCLEYMASTGEHHITQFMHARVDALTRVSCYCPFGAGIQGYDKLKLTLQAAGHDTSELHEAIKETLESMVKLKAARDKAVERFKEQGVLLKVVPVDKEEERLE
jgi:hypothetical protein